jgi:hypothetical protein
MNATSRPEKTTSPQQWAWEFLRRNPDYRDAFGKLSKLSLAQKAQMEMIAEGNEELPLDKEVIRTIDIKFFDTSVMLGYRGQQKTIGEYMDQTQSLRDAMNEPETKLWIAPKFKLKTYSIATWFDPSVEWPQDVADTMWGHTTQVELGLTPAPWAAGQSFESGNETDDHVGWPVRDSDTGIKNKVDKRRRKAPLRARSGVPVLKGTDESIYLLTYKDVNLDLDQTQACVVIDLNLPIDFQLNQAKEFLEEHQAALVRGGFVQKLPKQADRFGTFEEYLKILDLLEAGASHLDIATELDGLVPRTVSWKRDPASNESKPVKRMTSQKKPGAKVNELTQSVRKKIERAIHLRDHGYRALALSE